MMDAKTQMGSSRNSETNDGEAVRGGTDELSQPIASAAARNGATSAPARACVCAAGKAVKLEPDSEAANENKSLAVRIVARSPRPIEHWWWGRVVHDLDGMRLSKPNSDRIALDYVHDERDVIGYAHHFERHETDGLVATGTLISTHEGDRASRLMAQLRAGVPYEASINFGGEGIVEEVVAVGKATTVNGLDFAGPGTVIRQWPLRGLALCPYGADSETSATLWAADQERGEYGIETRTDREMPSEAGVEGAIVPEADATAVDGASAPEPTELRASVPDRAIDRDLLRQWLEAYGAEIALAAALAGDDEAAAQKRYLEALKADNAALRLRIEMPAGAAAASYSEGESGAAAKQPAESEAVVLAKRQLAARIGEAGAAYALGLKFE